MLRFFLGRQIPDETEGRVLTGDRRLTLEEQEQFLRHDTKFATKITEGEGEPTLHDVVLIEVIGRLDAQKEVIIDLGAKIRNLQYELEGLRQRLDQIEEEKKVPS